MFTVKLSTFLNEFINSPKILNYFSPCNKYEYILVYDHKSFKFEYFTLYFIHNLTEQIVIDVCLQNFLS